jgi:hypothetical protein
MTEVKRPARLDMTDMPRDPQRALGGLRKMLCATFNYTRKYPTKLAVFKETLKYVYNRISEYEKELAQCEKSVESVKESVKESDKSTTETTSVTKAESTKAPIKATKAKSTES